MQSLREEDEAISVRLTSGDKDIIVGTSNGMLIRFNEQDVRSMGRNAAGVKAITLGEEDQVVGMEIVEEDVNVLIVTKMVMENVRRLMNIACKAVVVKV